MTIPVETSTLTQGARLIHKPVAHNNILAIRVNFRRGAALDTDDRAGLVHLTLRLLLKGTETRTAVGISNAVESLGAHIGTETQKDYAGINLQCTTDTLEPCLEILGDVLTHSNFPEAKVANEKNAVIRQIHEEEDHSLSQTYRLFQRHFYGQHPYATPTAGLEETVRELTRDQVVDQYRQLSHPEDMVLTVVGHADPGELQQLFEKALPGGSDGKTRAPAPEVTLPVEKTADENHRNIRETDAEYIVLGYPAPPASDPDYFAFRVLDAVMGGSMNSRLFLEVREKRGLAYQIGTDYPVRAGNAHFAIYMGTAPTNHDLALETIQTEVAKVRTEVASEVEIERAKMYLRGIFIMAQETNRGQAGLLSRSEILGLGLDYPRRFLEETSKVTPEDVRRVAEKYLTHYTLVATAPETQ